MFFIVEEVGKLSRSRNQTWDPELTEILKIKKFFFALLSILIVDCVVYSSREYAIYCSLLLILKTRKESKHSHLQKVYIHQVV